jgi:hypothetical protein
VAGSPRLDVAQCDSEEDNVRGINTARVVIGGIVAGLVINVSEFILNMVVLGADMNAAMTRLNLPPVGGQAIAVFVLLGFALGIATIWLYAAIRPRYGSGPKTALCAGAAVWFFAYFYSAAGMMAMRMFPGRMMAVGMIWGLGEVLLASVAGASLYTE